MARSVAATGLLASLLVSSAATADKIAAGLDAPVSRRSCIDGEKTFSRCSHEREPFERPPIMSGKVVGSKTAVDVGSSQANAQGILPESDSASAAPAERAICPKSHDRGTALATPGPRREFRVCRPIMAALKGVSESSRVDVYLCGVYWRMPRKIDNAGDFSWKDGAAALRVERTICEYAIQGMHPDLREELYAFGIQSDAAGLNWSFLSAFRDDYRQSIAEGFKASACQSWHGGSCRTNGWGDGRAADLWVADENGEPAGDASALFEMIDRVGRSLGLSRPLPSADPPHVQLGGDWKGIGEHLRQQRLGIASMAVD